MQQRSYGDQLLECMLHRCALMSGVSKVIAVARCTNYRKHARMNLEQYIALRNERGMLLDTGLRVHEIHGAEVKELVADYRPQDIENKGFGVLVQYDIHNRRRKEIDVEGEGGQRVRGKVKDDSSIHDFIVRAVASIIGETNEADLLLVQP